MSSEAQFPMKAYVARQSEARLDRFAYQLGRSGKSTDPDTVHDLRVSIRRYESCVKAFDGFFAARPVRKFHNRLGEVLKPAGLVRDRDIALGLALEAGLRRDTPLVAALSRQRKRLAKSLSEEVKRWTKRHPSDKWRRRLAAALNDDTHSAKSIWDSARTSSENAAAVLPKIAKDFFRRGHKIVQPDTPDKKLHRFRLRAKRFRYTLELFKPCYGPTLSEHIAAVKRMQDQLGTMNDCAATLDLIAASDLADLDGAQQLRDYLEHRSQLERAHFFEYWQGTFGSNDDEKRWMDYLEHFAGRVAKSQLQNVVATTTRMLA